MAWSSVAIGFAGFAAGIAVTAGYYEHAARTAAEQRANNAEKRPAEQLAAERSIVEGERKRKADQQQARAAVSAAPELADVPLPDHLASLLEARMAATRARAGGGPGPAGAVQRPADAGLPGDRSPSEDLR